MKKRFAMIVMSLVMLTTALGGTAQAADIPATEYALAFQSKSAPEIRIEVAEKKAEAEERARAAEARRRAEAKREADAKHQLEDPIYLAHPTLEDILPSMPARPDDSFYDACGECDGQDGCEDCLVTKDPTKCTCKNWTYGWDPCLYKDKKCKHSGWMESTYRVPIPGTCTAMWGVGFYCKDCDRLGWKGVANNGPTENHQCIDKRKDRTCTQDGYFKSWCKNCGKVFDDSILLALGHSWQYEYDKKWNRLKKCSICGLTWQGSDEDFPVPEGTQAYMPQGEEDLLHDDADLIHGHDGNRKK